MVNQRCPWLAAVISVGAAPVDGVTNSKNTPARVRRVTLPIPSVNHKFPSEAEVIPPALADAEGIANSVSAPEAVRRPRLLPGNSVNQRAPSKRLMISSPKFPLEIRYYVTTPAGVILLMTAFPSSVGLAIATTHLCSVHKRVKSPARVRHKTPPDTEPCRHDVARSRT